jgi:predicted Zn-dependent protease
MSLKVIKNNNWVFVLIFILFILVSFKEKPCNSPITYKIGTFDTEFGISKEEFLNSINEASDIWGNSVDKKLFEYNPKGDLTINLIYDYRQNTTQKNELLRTDAKKISELATSIKQQYLSLQDEYKIREQEYLDLLSKFEQHKDDYDAQVIYWNNTGGAPKKEYDKLNNQKESLINEQDILENKRQQVNALIAQINLFINKYNMLIKDVNQNINKINQTAGKEFEEGVYDSGNNEITIYEFSTNKKLIRVLAHELGHALSLDHNNNSNSIMYALNESNTLVLSDEDLLSLKEKCKL